MNRIVSLPRRVLLLYLFVASLSATLLLSALLLVGLGIDSRVQFIDYTRKHRARYKQ